MDQKLSDYVIDHPHQAVSVDHLSFPPENLPV
jgi:hypothetical protein